METGNKQLNRKKLFVLILSVGLIILIAGMGLRAFIETTTNNQEKTATPTPTLSATSTPNQTKLAPTPSPEHKAPALGVSVNPPATAVATAKANAPVNNPVVPNANYLYGTNIALKDGSDQVLTSAPTRALLQQMRIPIYRIPIRDGQPPDLTRQAAQTVKNLGAIPLVILNGDKVTPNALENDIEAINIMNSVFGGGLVYYEYGNEQDLHGVEAPEYTDSWNRLVPQLKKLAANGRFIGPVNYEYNHLYLEQFLKTANPRPDAVSWHEYTCGSEWENERCMQNLNNWPEHTRSARSIMAATIGTQLPIMITEWNYTPNPAPNDGKINNPEFMKTWTTKALQSLSAAGVYAAMHFACTNYSIPLVNEDNTLSEQGQIFTKR